MRAVLGVCVVAFFMLPLSAADEGWGEPVNGLSVRVAIAAEDAPKTSSKLTVEYSLSNRLKQAMKVQLGTQINSRFIPDVFALVEREPGAAIRQVLYTGLSGFSASIFRPWVVEIGAGRTFTFREPVRNYGRLPDVLAGHRALWAEIHAPRPPREECTVFCWSGLAFSNIVTLPQ